MLKRLAIFGLLLGGVGAWSQVPGDGSHQNQKPQWGESRASVSQPVPSPSIHGQQAVSDQKKDSTPKPYEYPWRELYWPATIPNWCLALVGIWAGGMAYWTLRNIEKQTEQLRRQTDLLGRQLESTFQRERAKLNLSPQQISLHGDEGFFHLSTSIELTNIGHSKGYIIFSAGRFSVVPSHQWPLTSPDPDEFTLPSNVIDVSGNPIYVSFWFEHIPFDLNGFRYRIATGNLKIYLYGFVEYETMGKRLHRDFGYIWSIDEREGLNSEQADGVFTNGWWQQDLRQKNTEYEITDKPN